MWLIISLVVVGLLLLIAELILLPGISVAGIGAGLSLLGAILYAYGRYGVFVGSMVLTVVVILAVLAVIISLRANTWQRFALKSTIDSTSGKTPEEHDIRIGQTGVALTRLAPMGKVKIGDITLEAKSIDAFVDQQSAVEVTGFDNSVVVVKKINS